MLFINVTKKTRVFEEKLILADVIKNNDIKILMTNLCSLHSKEDVCEISCKNNLLKN